MNRRAERTAFVIAFALAMGCVAAPTLAATDSEPQVHVALREQVAVNRSAVVLSDVADVDGDGVLSRRLKALSIGHVAFDGDFATIERSTLARWITTCLDISPNAFALTGAAITKIHLAVASVSGDQIARLAQDSMRQALANSGLDVHVGLLQLPPDLPIPPGRLELKVRSLPAAQWAEAVREGKSSDAVLARREAVWVDAWVDGAFIRTVPVTVELAVYGPAYVSVRPLQAGRPVSATDPDSSSFRIETVDWADRRSLPLTVDRSHSSRDEDTLLLRHSLTAGQLLQRNDVVQKALVSRGQQATLHIVEGDIEMESQVEVLEDGMAGQNVRVKRADISTSILAEVTGRGKLEMRQ